jgi:uncharacterized membrane protein
MITAMHKSVALFVFALTLLVMGCSGGEEKASPGTGTAPAGNMNSMKGDDPTKGPIPGAADANFTTVKASLENFCYPCHNAQNKKDDVNIESLDSAEKLKAVVPNLLEVLEGKKMPPPAAAKHPTDEERAAIIAALKSL